MKDAQGATIRRDHHLKLRSGDGAAITLIALAASSILAAADVWPEFRGPSMDGVSDAVGLPLTWSEKENVVWKSPVHDRGWSTPVVWGGQVWLTTATEDGREMFAVCLDRETGKVVHDLKLFHNEDPEPLGADVNRYASPSPSIEEGRVFVHFGSYGTACLDTSSGKVLWQRRDLPCRHFRGPGSSPILHAGFVILTMDGFDLQYVAALEKTTGKTAWKTDRSFEFGDMNGDFRKAYSTPFIARTTLGLQLLSCGAKAGYGYDPDTGKELWRVRYDGFSNASRPLYFDGHALMNTGYPKADIWAVKVDGRGDVTDTHVAWKARQSVPASPSPVLSGDLLFMVSDGGVASCLEARTGKQVWTERIGGKFWTSPILAAGRIYVSSEDGKTTVFEASRELKRLAANQLDGEFLASPAVAGKALFLRTKTHVYRIEERSGAGPDLAPADDKPAKGPLRAHPANPRS